MSKVIRTRFAPSPTGYLHVGGARTALYSWLYAKKNKGQFVLRIEDTDQARSTKESQDMLIEDLKWLGLDWDEGDGKGGDFAPYQQSQRLQIYLEHAERLLKSSKAFYCFCSDAELEQHRTEAQAQGLPPQYNGKCRSIPLETAKARLADGETATVRFRTPSEKRDYAFNDIVRKHVSFPSDMVGDFVILRSDGMPVYNFCCVVDDALMNITHVLRAEEHLSNTLRQMMLYEAFDYPLPEFGHISLILGTDRQKLSKRHGATSCNQYREMGYHPDALNNYLALLGWSSPNGDEILSRQMLVDQFDLDRLNPAAAVFDEVKLKWVNATHLRAMPSADLWKAILPFLEKAELNPSEQAHWQDVQWQERCLNLFKTSMETFADAVPLFQYLVRAKLAYDAEALEVMQWPEAKAVVSTWQQELSRAGSEFLTEAEFLAIQEKVKVSCAVKGKQLFMPIRVAVIAKAHGAELKHLVPLIPVRDLLARAETALAKIK